MKNVKWLVSVGLIVYLMLLVRVIILKYPDEMMSEILRTWSPAGMMQQAARVNLIPFKTIGESLFNPSVPVQLPTLIYNIAAFVPLGFLIPLVTDRARRLVIVLLVALGVSLFLEVVQVLTRLGDGDIDDILLNVVGAAVGYGILVFVLWLSRSAARFSQPQSK
ncbi:MAG: VanZ family protein [Anaerolineae bacterium]